MKNLLLIPIFFLGYLQVGSGQVLCVKCFDQNGEISPGVNNLVMNGGFESTNCIPGWLNTSFCPNSNLYGCDIDEWLCTGGDVSSYPSVFDSTLSVIPEGNNAAYFGNGNAFTCSETWGDFSCEILASCEIKGFPLGYPKSLPGYGDQIGVSLEQTVSGLIIGQTYVLEFWAGGEPLQGLLNLPGIFAVDVGFGKIYLECKPTGGALFPTGTVFIIEFTATSTSHTIKFTNWGHVCAECTELVIDNVRLYIIEELSPAVTPCISSTNGPKENISVEIFPNPFNSILNISTSFPDGLEFNLYNSLAEKVLHADFTSFTTLNAEQLESGIYFFEIRNKKGLLSSGKLVNLEP